MRKEPVVVYCKVLFQNLPGEIEENSAERQSGLPISGPKFEP
jgi:hypothetical protein